MAEAGLRGLSQVLFRRTSIEPADPMGVNLETDELSVYPFLYWPITPNQPRPSSEAYARLNRYLRTGGLILFDTRDADTSGFSTAIAKRSQVAGTGVAAGHPTAGADPADHVLTRTFYLLQDFPGRYVSREVWVEAAPADAEQAEGMPFRNLNDNVTPVVIGGNDWAAAWAVDARGCAMLPVGRGFAGERQREIAYRFGVNLIMHVLTGNYKSDQVHVSGFAGQVGAMRACLDSFGFRPASAGRPTGWAIPPGVFRRSRAYFSQMTGAAAVMETGTIIFRPFAALAGSLGGIGFGGGVRRYRRLARSVGLVAARAGAGGFASGDCQSVACRSKSAIR